MRYRWFETGLNWIIEVEHDLNEGRQVVIQKYRYSLYKC